MPDRLLTLIKSTISNATLNNIQQNQTTIELPLLTTEGTPNK